MNLEFCLPSTILSVITMSLLVAPGAAKAHADPDEICSQIAAAYSACGEKFSFDNGHFRFETALGRRDISCSDGRSLEFYDRIESMDLASLLMIPYVPGVVPLPEKRRNHDPGRLHVDDLQASVFGGTREEVRANLTSVEFLGQKIPFQKHLGAAAALGRVGKQIMAAAAKDPKLAKFIEPFTSKKIDLRNYTNAWRTVKGTTRLSSHSFATAIDLLTNVGPMYWLWDATKADPERAKRGEVGFRDIHFVARAKPIMPQPIVDAFEANGFIWGGKWNHYDTMHFEYRPEFFPGLAISCPQ
jgi:hypothetical protein